MKMEWKKSLVRLADRGYMRIFARIFKINP